jgi:pilus assembly protein CpaE
MDKKILIVDDDLESLKLVGLMLQRRGYEIIVAHGGSQALVKAEAESPDLVILDVMMPDMDGYQVCQQLRSKPRTARVPVLMFTAKTLVGDKVAGFRAGADDYLTKPIHPSELVAHVEALLQRAEQAHLEATDAPRTRVVGVMGAKGGVGASTLVVNLALMAGQNDGQAQGQDTEKRVGVVDLRSGLGTLAVQLGQMPQGGWATLAERDADSLDHDAIDSQVITHSSGLHCLPASLQPKSGKLGLPPKNVDVVLKHMAETFDLLFLDMGCVLDEATRRAIVHCDVLLVVVEPEFLCLVSAQRLLESIKMLDSAPSDLRVVLVQRSETEAAYSQEEVEDSLGYELAGVIKPAGPIVRQAAEQGEPIILACPESDITGQFRALSQALAA